MMSSTAPKTYNIAIIGGGITGAAVAHALSKQNTHNINIHLFDQGRRGVGGRSSHRGGKEDGSGDSSNTGIGSNKSTRYDHGCQFFRADTDRFRNIVEDLKGKGIVREWKGNFISSSSSADHKSRGGENFGFFGLPSSPPFYVGADGMQSVPKGILNQIMMAQSERDKNDEEVQSSSSSAMPQSTLSLFTGTRVAQLYRDEIAQKWRLFGTSGTAAFHDTPESVVKKQNEKVPLPLVRGGTKGCLYDGVILTDVSSSFGKWHRASAGVPESFAARVRERVGARVPLFTAMIAFEKKSGIPFDAATFDNNVLWFASKNNSKPGMDMGECGLNECWTLVSTPEYAMEKIEETPMQDPETGDFIPQSKDYLATVPGPDLKTAFHEELTSKNGVLGDNALMDIDIPHTIHMDAQRWGSAMPCHRHLDETSKTRKIISGVPYDSGRSSLAPTKVEKCSRRLGDERSFLVDEDLMLFQAGDMVSTMTPGFEGAALSGLDAAKFLVDALE